ncbi:MAG: GNAT family N-acetyltransferase [Lachnospiraceae bacterium]|nr:GNAT family N-acetyltransferase [Lachnospiraceae bacterium]MBQ7260658.1 GNAT family N-acetyltransferase [Lachnospiraceae bacterium]HAV00997.1 GNAT family N-acetyltransferase [Lachnospiraceae bacterium]
MDRQAYEIHPLNRGEWEDAMQLAWDTFLIFEAPEYGREGIDSFRRFIKDPLLKRMFIMGEYLVYGAYLRQYGDLVGILGVRGYNHVSLLFVQAEYHLQGIAKAMLYKYINEARRKQVRRITVHSSPFAVEFYHKQGFVDLDREIVADGIRYTPMELII